MEDQALADINKYAAKEGRVIVFVDESGLSERPTLVRTWLPRGQTPVVQYSFTWKQLSVIAGVSFWRFYFRLFPGAILAPQCIDFLKTLERRIGKKLLTIWDGLVVHKSRLVRQFIEGCKGKNQVEFLPAYSPELNPIEYLFGHLKPHELGNLCSRNIDELSEFARRRMQSMQRRTKLVTAFWKKAELHIR